MNTRLDELRESVTRFHLDNPAVWTLFDRFTRSRISRGFRHYSVNAIFERIRWETDQSADGGFKLNNNYRAFYARRWMKLNPDYDGFFRTRVQTSGLENAVNLPELTPANFPTWPTETEAVAPDVGE